MDLVIILNIKVFKDGGVWCALIGKDLQSGIGGFGITSVNAIRDLCNNIEKEPRWRLINIITNKIKIR